VRVLLAPFEVAGVAAATRHGLRARGHDADVWVIAPHPFTATEDRRAEGYARRALAGLEAPLRYDVLHFQFGTTLAEFADVAWGRVAGRPLVVMQYHGDDCRIRLGPGGLVPPGADHAWVEHQRRRERVIRRRLRIAGRVCAAAIVQDFEIASFVRPYFRSVYMVPTPVILPLPAPELLPPLEGEGPIVFHAPSHQLIKGTAAISAAIDAVARRRPLRPIMVTGSPRSTVLAELARADVVIDQLNVVTTGVLALEAMAHGRPVLTAFERELLAPEAQSTPAVPVTAATVEAELEALLDDPERRRVLGEAGRQYVPRVHDATRVAGLVEGVYEHARSGEPGLFEASAAGIRPLSSPR
jgi:hypothetical protein